MFLLRSAAHRIVVVNDCDLIGWDRNAWLVKKTQNPAVASGSESDLFIILFPSALRLAFDVTFNLTCFSLRAHLRAHFNTTTSALPSSLKYDFDATFEFISSSLWRRFLIYFGFTPKLTSSRLDFAFESIPSSLS